MIESKQFNYCNACEKGKAHDQLVELGKRVFVPGKSWTQYTFFQCSSCGHIWQYIEDGGLGGHGHHYSKLTHP